MSRQRWRAGGVVLGLLLLAGPGRADEATAIEAIKKLGGRVEVDARAPGGGELTWLLDPPTLGVRSAELRCRRAARR